MGVTMADHNPQQAPVMRKWDIYLNSGDHFTMLSEQCQDAEEALAAAKDKWGLKVDKVMGTAGEVAYA